MIHYVDQLVFTVCLFFGAEQVVYSGFIRAFYWKQLLATVGNNANESKQKNYRNLLKLKQLAENG